MKKKNEVIIAENLEAKNGYEDKIKAIEKKMNIQSAELTSQYNKLESEKRKLEIELDNMEILLFTSSSPLKWRVGNTLLIF